MKSLQNRLVSRPASSRSLRLFALLLSGPLVWSTTTLVFAQAVTFSGKTPAVNFGNINLCAKGKTIPAPCSEVETLTYKVTESGTLDTPKVLTLGAPGLDFTLVSGSTCTGKVSVGATCTVKVQFEPRISGSRPGAVLITGGSGKAISTTPIYGNGIGPQIGTLLNGAVTTIDFNPSSSGYNPIQPAVDGAGNVYLAVIGSSDVGEVIKVSPGGEQSKLPFDFSGTIGPAGKIFPVHAALAVDGAGDLFVTTYASGASGQGLVLELLNNGSTISLPFNGLVKPAALAVDGSGDLFVLDAGVLYTNNSRSTVTKLPFGCQSSSCQTTVASYFNISEMTADVAGDVYLLYTPAQNNTPILEELPVGGGTPKTIASNPQIIGLAVDGLGDLFSTVDIPTYEGSGDYDLVDIVAAEFPGDGSTPFTNQFLGSYDTIYNYPIAATADLSGNLITAVTESNEVFGTEIISYSRTQFASLDFGTVKVGSSATNQLDITNIGNRTLVVTPSFTSPSYKITKAQPAGCLDGIPASQSCVLQIEFTALKKGNHTIELTLKTNGPSNTTLLMKGVGN